MVPDMRSVSCGKSSKTGAEGNQSRIKTGMNTIYTTEQTEDRRPN